MQTLKLLEARVARARAVLGAAIETRAREHAQAAIEEYFANRIDEVELKRCKEAAYEQASAEQKGALTLETTYSTYAAAAAARVAAEQSLAMALTAEDEAAKKVDEALWAIESQERVRLRAREGEAVEWTRRAAQRAGTLKDMMDDAPTEDGIYPVPMIAAAELAVLREMCEADSMPARLEQCSISELFRLVEGASFLDAPGALNHAQCALATRLNGKRADELRELLGATDDFGSAENRVAALAEPAFSPEGQLSVATAGSAAGPPALQQHSSLSGMAVTDDAKEAALGMVDVGTLAELKGVSRSWLALARRVLCSRLSRCEGQPAPTHMAEITDLNIKVLVDAGRPWEAAAAGRMLPNLARLHWEGFEVNVAAVREVDLDERDEDEEPSESEPRFFEGPAKTALLSCIEGEGEPPLELLLAAVACAGSGEIHSIPVQMMRDDSVSELNWNSHRFLGFEGAMLLAYLVPVMGALTSIDLSNNNLTDYGTNMTVVKKLAAALGVNGGLTKIE